MALTGLRYYSPRLGKWISRDPIGERGGFNLSAFVGNTPVALIDILGLEDCTVTVWIGHNNLIYDSIKGHTTDTFSANYAITCGGYGWAAAPLSLIIANEKESLPFSLDSGDFISLINRAETTLDLVRDGGSNPYSNLADWQIIEKRIKQRYPYATIPDANRARELYVDTFLLDAMEKARDMATKEDCDCKCPDGIRVKIEMVEGFDVMGMSQQLLEILRKLDIRFKCGETPRPN